MEEALDMAVIEIFSGLKRKSKSKIKHPSWRTFFIYFLFDLFGNKKLKRTINN